MNDFLWALAFFVFSLLIWGYWGIGLFTDTRLSQMIRRTSSMTKRRPDLSLFFPASAAVLLSTAIMMGIQAFDGPACASDAAGLLALILAFAAFVIYWSPVPLPKWTDPVWQERRHAQHRADGFLKPLSPDSHSLDPNMTQEER